MHFIIVEDNYIYGPMNSERVIAHVHNSRQFDEDYGNVFVASGNELIPVTIETTLSEFDSDAYAYGTIKAIANGQIVANGTYRIDGRA